MQVLTVSPLLTADLAVTEVMEPAGAQRADARVADPLAAAERELQARLLAADEDWLGAVGPDLAITVQKPDRPALAGLAPADLWLKSLHVQTVEDTLALASAR